MRKCESEDIMTGMTEKTKDKKKIVSALILVGVIALSVIGVGISEYNRTYHERHIEAGVTIHAQDFLKNSEDRGYFTLDSEMVDKSIPGEYHLKLRTGWFVQDCRLIVSDTIPPAAQPKTVYIGSDQECEAKELVTDIVDETDVQVSFVEKPDFSRGGKQEVTVRLVDAGGNSTDINSEIILSQVVEELDVEAGSHPPKVEDFVIDGKEAKFVTKIASYDCMKPGTKTVSIEVDGIVYQSKMNVIDTTPPQASLHDVESYMLLPRKPEDFVESVDDVTQVQMTYVREPDLSIPGSQNVEIRFVDEGGNETVKTAELFLMEDTEAPVITGAADMSILIGQAAAYRKNVTATDNCPEGLSFTVDTSAVDLNREGVYPVVYTATDYAGNSTSVTVHLSVQPRAYDADQVNAKADEVLGRIITPGMAPIDQVRAIFDYVKSHVGYINHSEKGDQMRAAYEGFVNGKGDCYVYACMTKVLLTRAGIANMDIVKIPAKTSHYWNLVNLGDGWYHLDTTPRKDHPTIFMWTEAELMEYSGRHSGSHNYDHSQYPVVN